VREFGFQVAANVTSALRTLLIARVGEALERELDWQPIDTTRRDGLMAAVTR
jgi:hypothetical protein